MPRPFISWSIVQLEEEFGRATKAGDRQAIESLKHELEFRKTSRAQKLKSKINQSDTGASTRASSAPVNQPDTQQRQQRQSQHQEQQRSNGAQSGTGRSKLEFSPTGEQYEAIEEFKKGGSLKINAYAGTGKTSTLQFLSHSTSKRGIYIAFNRAIVADAKDKFPNTVNCSTIHSLAFRATPYVYKNNKDKMTGKINAKKLAEVLGLKVWRIDRNHSLHPPSQAYLILSTLKRFAQSSDTEPSDKHFPRYGALLSAPETTIKAVKEFAINEAKIVWARMKNEHDEIPLGHDGYLKLWALSNPTIPAEYILLDEAQDTNPVVLGVLKNQQAQMIYVGDKYQQIYEWRGAINAMEEIPTDSSTYLTQSFRFGTAIADAASKILRQLNETRPLTGNPAIKSRIGPVIPRTILARTNATIMTAIIEALDQGKKPCLVGGIGELMEMLRGVQDLKNGIPSNIPDFFGFQSWQEVVEFARSEEADQQLLTFVNLVETRGERQLMWALNRVVEEDRGDIIISTAHKAKGREWSTVRLMDDFLKSLNEQNPDKKKELDEAELRLFYVAFTRAKEGIEVSPALLPLLS